LRPKPEKMRAILDAPKPDTKRQVRSFLGLVGFYRRFIPNFAHIALPLTDLTRKGELNRVSWSDAMSKHFKPLESL